MLGAASLSGPLAIEKIRLVNDAEFDVQLYVAPSDDSSLWLRLPVAIHDAERTVEGVIDPGAEWTVHARSQGLDGGMWVVDRDELEADGWRLEIPDQVIGQLRENGAAPTPP